MRLRPAWLLNQNLKLNLWLDLGECRRCTWGGTQRRKWHWRESVVMFFSFYINKKVGYFSINMYNERRKKNLSENFTIVTLTPHRSQTGPTTKKLV
jgi:hypothetical protein